MALVTNPEATRALLGFPTDRHGAQDFIPLLRRGFPSKTVAALSKSLELPAVATWQLLGLAPRTLARRLSGRGRLTLDESERVLRLALVLTTAVDVFGTIEKARAWLQKESRVLGDVPLRLLDTDVGASLVLDELGRIEHGVFA